MFGYVKPYKNELKLKTIQYYSEVYCSLCQALKKNFGFLSRFTVNYDITFLYFVLLTENMQNIHIKFRCPFNPLKLIETSISAKNLDYCAGVNYLLTVEKLNDDRTDTKGLKGLFTTIIYNIFSSNKKYKDYIHKNFEFYSECKQILSKYYEMEKNSNSDFDELLNTFGHFFKAIISNYHNDNFEKDKEIILEFAFQLGKWICLIDALDDYNDDIKKKRFNILTLIDKNIESSELIRIALTILQMIKSKMKICLRKCISLQSNEVVSNFIMYGCQSVEGQIIKSRYKDIIEKGEIEIWKT